MPALLTADKLEEIRADAFADDLAIDLDKMQHWTEEQAANYFSSGGTDESTPAAVNEDMVLSDDDLAPGAGETPAATPPPALNDGSLAEPPPPPPAAPLPAADLVLEEEEQEAAAPPPAADLVLEEEVVAAEEEEEDCPQPVFQTGGGDGSMIPREADKETASNAGGLEAPPGSVVTPTAAPPPPASGGKDSDGRPTAKAVLVGDSGVGKTSLMLRFSQDLYHTNSKATIGVDLFTRDVPLPRGEGALSLQMWDTAGQEQFASLTTSYFRAAHCVVMAYDVHNPASFASLAKWMIEVDR